MRHGARLTANSDYVETAMVRPRRPSPQTTAVHERHPAPLPDRHREVEPRLPIVALTNGQQFLQAGQPGASPWLGGIDIDDFDGSLQQRYVAATTSFGADAVSPVHGGPQNGRVGDPGYVPFTTLELVGAAHDAGMRVIPWTVNDRATTEALMDIGVGGIITDRPDLVRQILAERGERLPRAYRPLPG
jgi:glycerophosphoryl diester phosphodiesterase